MFWSRSVPVSRRFIACSRGVSHVPASMKAVTVSAAGGPENLRVSTIPVPALGPTDVLVKVAYAGVNGPDIMQRQGKYPAPKGACDRLGLEVSGIVVALGGSASFSTASLSSFAPNSLEIGDKVCGLTNGGGYAEYCVVPAAQCLKIPPGMPFKLAAAVPETYFTVWHNVFQRAGLRNGEKFLVHGGASGIGTTAIQLAKAVGASVFTTAGSDEKCAACMRIGADIAINYRSYDFAALLHEGGIAIDVVLDMVCGDYFEKNLKVMNYDGRLVIIAFKNGSKVQADISRIMLKRLLVTGSTLRSQSAEDKASLALAVAENVMPLLDAGKALPHIDSMFVLEDVAKAHSRLESSAHFGKVVLEVGGEYL